VSEFVEPPLIQPIDLVIEQIDKVATPGGGGVSGRGEPRNVVIRTEFTIQAQVVFGNVEQKMHSTQLGIDEESRGYAIFRTKDFEDAGKSVKRGDRIVKFIDKDGKETILEPKLYFTHSRGDLGGHFSSGGFAYTRILFIDRNPVG